MSATHKALDELKHSEEERFAWDTYVAGLLSRSIEMTSEQVVTVANRMLEERRKRFGVR